jgi:hypothetical protein
MISSLRLEVRPAGMTLKGTTDTASFRAYVTSSSLNKVKPPLQGFFVFHVFKMLSLHRRGAGSKWIIDSHRCTIRLISERFLE